MLGLSFEVYDSAADGFILRFLKSKNKCVLRKEEYIAYIVAMMKQKVEEGI